MKKILVSFLALSCAVVLAASASAADGKKKRDKHPLTAEQEALQKDMLEKYDTDKNGKLSKEERAKISKTDRKKMSEAGLGRKKDKAKNKDTAEAK
jgi:hypothetical protein